MSKKQELAPGDKKTALLLRPGEVFISHAISERSQVERSDLMSLLGVPVPVADEVAAESLQSGRYQRVRVIPIAYIPATGRKLARHYTVVGIPAT